MFDSQFSVSILSRYRSIDYSVSTSIELKVGIEYSLVSGYIPISGSHLTLIASGDLRLVRSFFLNINVTFNRHNFLEVI